MKPSVGFLNYFFTLLSRLNYLYETRSYRNSSWCLMAIDLILTPWLMEPGGSMSHSRSLSKSISYNVENSSHIGYRTKQLCRCVNPKRHTLNYVIMDTGIFLHQLVSKTQRNILFTVTCSTRGLRGFKLTQVGGCFQDVKIISTSPPERTSSRGSRVRYFRLFKEHQAWKIGLWAQFNRRILILVIP